MLTPSNPNETKIIFNQWHDEEGPKYIRLGKGGERNLLSDAQINNYIHRKAQILKKEKDILFVSSGPILEEVLEAVKMFSQV